MSYRQSMEINQMHQQVVSSIRFPEGTTLSNTTYPHLANIVCKPKCWHESTDYHSEQNCAHMVHSVIAKQPDNSLLETMVSSPDPSKSIIVISNSYLIWPRFAVSNQKCMYIIIKSSHCHRFSNKITPTSCSKYNQNSY